MLRRLKLLGVVFLWSSIFMDAAMAQERIVAHLIPLTSSVETLLILTNHEADTQAMTLSGFNHSGDPLAEINLTLDSGAIYTVETADFGNGLAHIQVAGSLQVSVVARHVVDKPFGAYTEVAASSVEALNWQLSPAKGNGSRQSLAIVNRGLRQTTVHTELVGRVSGLVLQSTQTQINPNGQTILRLDRVFDLPRLRNPLDLNKQVVVRLRAVDPISVTSLVLAHNRQTLWQNPAEPLGILPPVRQIPLLGSETFPEGIASNRETGDVFVGGLGDGSIQRVIAGVTSYFVAPGSAGLKNVVGLEVDPERNRLWVCNSDFNTFVEPEIIIFDIPSANVLARFSIPDDGGFHFFNEVTIDSFGQAYMTDSTGPAIWTVDPDLNGLTIFLEDADHFQIQGGFNLNGIVVTPDDRFLIAALPRSNGSIVYRIDMSTKEVIEVEIDGLFVSGDGLTFRNQTDLVAIGFDVTQLAFDCHFDSAKLEFFPSLTQHFDFATTGDISSDSLIVVNGQLDHFFRGDGEQDAFTLAEVPLSRLK